MNTLTRPRKSNEASQYLWENYGIRRSPQTLAKQRVVGGGPPFRKAGRDVLYNEVDLDAYAAEITSSPVRSTSELPARYRRQNAAERANPQADSGASEVLPSVRNRRGGTS